MEAPTTQSSQSRGVARILGKLDTNLEEGNFYEAHQNYKTLCYRYVIVCHILSLPLLVEMNAEC